MQGSERKARPTKGPCYTNQQTDARLYSPILPENGRLFKVPDSRPNTNSCKPFAKTHGRPPVLPPSACVPFKETVQNTRATSYYPLRWTVGKKKKTRKEIFTKL